MSQPPEYTEEELKALEAEMEKITVDDVLLQTIVSLINLAARKGGLTAPPGEGPPPDWEQMRLGIEACRALMALVEPRHGSQLGPIRDGLSRLQLHYAQNSGAAASGDQPGPEPGAARPPQPSPAAGGARSGEAQRSRLWIPGQ
jgi:hypothetical protein